MSSFAEDKQRFQRILELATELETLLDENDETHLGNALSDTDTWVGQFYRTLPEFRHYIVDRLEGWLDGI